MEKEKEAQAYFKALETQTAAVWMSAAASVIVLGLYTQALLAVGLHFKRNQRSLKNQFPKWLCHRTDPCWIIFHLLPTSISQEKILQQDG